MSSSGQAEVSSHLKSETLALHFHAEVCLKESSTAKENSDVRSGMGKAYRTPEVRNLGCAVCREQDVAAVEISVNNAFCMDVAHTPRNLSQRQTVRANKRACNVLCVGVAHSLCDLAHRKMLA